MAFINGDFNLSKNVREDAKGQVINREVKPEDERVRRREKKGRKGKRRYNRVIFSGSANARVGTRENFFVFACVSSLYLEKRIFRARRKQ